MGEVRLSWHKPGQIDPEVYGMFGRKWRSGRDRKSSLCGDASEIFLYFCMRCLALISLPTRRASVCGFLHEASVAVDFSFSSLSLCDIVYREKITNVNLIFDFKRGYCDTFCYCILSVCCRLSSHALEASIRFFPFHDICKMARHWFVTYSSPEIWGATSREMPFIQLRKSHLDQSIDASRPHI